MKITLIGAGNGGQAIAGYLGMNGYDVCLYDIDKTKIKDLSTLGGINLRGKINGFGKVSCFTTNIEVAIRNAEIVLVTTIANAHQAVAESIAPFAEDGQVFILSPGRTCGALVFKQTLLKCGCNRKIFVAEAQTLVYACRIIENGLVNIIGIKDEVLLAALPASDTNYVLNKIDNIYPCFKPANNVLSTSLENIGAIFHPCVLLMNAGTIERKTEFYFYRDMTERIAAFIEKFDSERLTLGKAYSIELLGVRDWIKVAYQDTEGDTLCERMRNNPGYYDIKSPSSIFVRQLTEDIPTGVLPMLELGKVAGVSMPLFESVTNISSALLGVNFRIEGRTLENLGLNNMNKEEIIEYIKI